MKKKRIVVAGGGASGMCAAIAAARSGAQVTLIEKTEILGKKITMTGNGRCNLSNEDENPEYYNKEAARRMDAWLARFGTKDTVAFFKSLGVVVQSEDGYLYPISGQAGTVQKALENELSQLGVEVVFKAQLKRIERDAQSGTIAVRTTNGDYPADAAIVAVGGLAGPKSTASTGDGYYIARTLGLHVTETVPALTALLSDDPDLPAASGVRMLAEIALFGASEEESVNYARIAASARDGRTRFKGAKYKESEACRGALRVEYGEVQLTSKGISGIPALQMSHIAAQLLSKKKEAVVCLNFFPEYSEEEFEQLVYEICRTAEGKTFADVLDGCTNHFLGEMVCRRQGAAPGKLVTKNSIQHLRLLLEELRRLKITICGVADYPAAQVTGGGVSLDDLDDDLQAREFSGVYFIGEMTDVDGRCGGYNLQWAWTSGTIAGSAAAAQ